MQGKNKVNSNFKSNWETQLNSLPPDVRSVAESLAMRDPESAQRYVSQYVSANQGRKS